MNVGHILATKGRDVITIQPHRTLGEVAVILAEKGIGAIVVAGAHGEVLGILSERDIVKAIAREGGDALSHAVSRYMTQKVVTASLNSTVDRLMEQMTEGRFRHVPIIEHNQLIGLVSIGDVVKSRVAQIEFETQSLKEYIATA